MPAPTAALEAINSLPPSQSASNQNSPGGASSAINNNNNNNNNAHERNVYIADLPRYFSEQHLQQLFSKFGTILSVRVNCGTDPSVTRNSYAFILFESVASAQAAIDGAAELSVDGAPLQVRLAKATNGTRGRAEARCERK